MSGDARVTLRFDANMSPLERSIRDQKIYVRKLTREYTALSKPIRDFDNLTNKTALTNSEIEKLKKNLEGMRKSLKGVEEGSEHWKKLNEEIATTEHKISENIKKFEELSKQLVETEPTKEFVEGLEPFAEAIRDAEAELKNLEDAQRLAHKVGVDGAEEYAKAVKEITKQKGVSVQQAERELALIEQRQKTLQRMGALHTRAEAEEAQRIATREKELQILGRLQTKAEAEDARRKKAAQDELQRMGKIQARAEADARQRVEAAEKAQRAMDVLHTKAMREDAERTARALEIANKAARDKERTLKAMELAALATSGSLRELAKIAGGVKLAFAGLSGTFQGFASIAGTIIQPLGTLFSKLETTRFSGIVLAFRDITGAIKNMSSGWRMFAERIQRDYPRIHAVGVGIGRAFHGIGAIIRSLVRAFIGLGAAVSGIFGIFHRLRQVFAQLTTVMQRLGHVVNRVLNLFRRVGRGMAAPWVSLANSVGMTSERFRRLLPQIRQFNRVSRISARRTEVLSSRLRRIIFAVLIFDHLRRAMRTLVTTTGDLIRANDELNNTLDRIRANLWTAFAPIWEFIQPHLLRFLQLIERLANRIAWVMTMLFGISWADATAAGEELAKIAGGYDDIADGADNARRQVQGFDQVNQRAQDTASGMADEGFEFPTIEPPDYAFQQWLEDLINAWRDQDWDWFRRQGEEVANIITNYLNNIDWAGIQDTARRLAAALANFLNGLLGDRDMWEAIGRTLAEGLNTALQFLYTFASELEWREIGEAIGHGINTFVEYFDWELLGRTINVWALGILDLFEGIIDEVNWDRIGQQIALLLNTIAWWEIFRALGRVMGKAFSAALETLYYVLSETNWAHIGASLANGIATLNDYIDWVRLGSVLAEGFNSALAFLNSFILLFPANEIGTNIATAINRFFEYADFAQAGTILSNGIRKVLSGITTLVQETDWLQIGESMRGFIERVEWTAIIRDMAFMIGSALGGLATMLHASIGEQVNAIRDFFAYHIEAAGGNIAQGLWNGILAGLGIIKAWIKKNIFDPFMDGFNSLFEISSPSGVMQTAGEFLVLGLIKGIRALLPQVLDAFFEISRAIKDILAEHLGIPQWLAWIIVNLPVIAAFGAAMKALYFTMMSVKTAALALAAAKGVLGKAITLVKGTKGFAGLKTMLTGVAGKAGFGKITAAIGVKGGAGILGKKGLYGLLAALGPKGWLAAGVVAGVTAIVASNDELKDNLVGIWANIRESGSEIWENAKEMFATIWESIKEFGTVFWDEFGDTIIETWERIKNFISVILVTLSNIIKVVFNQIKIIIETILNVIANVMEIILGVITGDWDRAWNGLLSLAETIWNAIVSTIKNIFTGAVAIIGNIITGILALFLPSEFFDAGRDIIQGVIDGITGMAGRAVDAARNVATGILDRFRDIFQMRSPSRVMVQMGKYICDGLAKGIEKYDDIPGRAMENLVEIIEKTVVVEFDNSTFKEGVKDLEGIVDWFGQSIVKPISDGFNDAFAGMGTDASKTLETIQKDWERIPKWFDRHVIEELTKSFENYYGWKQKTSKKTLESIQNTWQPANVWYGSTVIEPLRNSFDEYFQWLREESSNTYDEIQNTWQTKKEWFYTTIIAPLRDAFETMFGMLKQQSQTVVQGVKTAFQQLPPAIEQIAQSIQQTFDNLWQNLIRGAQDAANQISRALQEIQNAAQSAQSAMSGMQGFSGFGIELNSKTAKVGKTAPSNIVNNAYNNVYNTLMSPFSSSILDRMVATGSKTKSLSTNISGVSKEISELSAQINSMTQALGNMRGVGSSQFGGGEQTVVILKLDEDELARGIVKSLNGASERGIPVNLVHA